MISAQRAYSFSWIEPAPISVIGVSIGPRHPAPAGSSLVDHLVVGRDGFRGVHGLPLPPELQERDQPPARDRPPRDGSIAVVEYLRQEGTDETKEARQLRSLLVSADVKLRIMQAIF